MSSLDGVKLITGFKKKKRKSINFAEQSLPFRCSKLPQNICQNEAKFDLI